MWLEHLILKKAEKQLSPYRTQTNCLTREQSTLYEKYQPQLTKLYRQATHWHGTGRFQYERSTTPVNADVVDILEQIILSGGLQPHNDPWIDSGSETVSIATVRMHGRIYARVHLFETETLQYELGSVLYWSRLYFSLLFTWLIAHPIRHRSFLKKLLRPASATAIQHRVGTTRKPRNKKRFTIKEFIQGKALSSDITGNYPILFGVAARIETLIETIPLTHKVEQRSLQPITFNQCTHIEVPLNNVTETEQVLNRYHIELPVIPIEFGDLYLAKTPLKQLAFSTS